MYQLKKGNNIAKSDIFINNSSRGMIFASIGAGKDGEHNSANIVAICDIFMTRDIFFFETETVDRVYLWMKTSDCFSHSLGQW